MTDDSEGPDQKNATEGPDLDILVDDLTISPEARDRQLVLSGKDPHPTVSADGDLTDCLPIAKMTLVDVMTDRSAKASDRVAAADSVLDRAGPPRRKHEMGGSRQIVFNLPPTAMTDALRGMATLFKKEPIPDDQKLPPVPSPEPGPVHGERLEKPPAADDVTHAQGNS